MFRHVSRQVFYPSVYPTFLIADVRIAMSRNMHSGEGSISPKPLSYRHFSSYSQLSLLKLGSIRLL